MQTHPSFIDLQDISFNLFELLQIQQQSTAFSLEDYKQMLSEFYKFAINEISPSRMEADVCGVKLENGSVKVPPGLHKVNRLFYENGWFSFGFDEAIGGTPAPRAMVMATSSMSTGSHAAWTMYPGLSRAAMHVLIKIAPPEIKDIYIPRLMSGEWGGTMCLTEAGAGSDVGALVTTALPLENNRYQIKGTKIFISSGDNDLYKNIAHLVLARTPKGGPGPKGISLFLVPKYRVAADGSLLGPNDVTCAKLEEKMGIHASATCELNFGLEGQCEGILIGREFDGMTNMFIMMNEARLTCGLQGESQANFAVQMALHYCRERVQFGKTIIEHPDVSRMLLRIRSMARGLRKLCLFTATLMDKEGDPNSEKEVALLTPICKSYSTDEGFQVCVEALQCFGGYGYCREYGIEQYVRDAKIASIYEGTNGIQAIDFVMRKILRDNAETYRQFLQRIEKTLAEPPAQLWAYEYDLLATNIKRAKELLEHFVLMAQNNQVQQILAHTSDFLRFNGHLIVAWLHLQAAMVAQQKLQSEEKQYYMSKIVDYQAFCSYHLVQNFALAETMLHSKLNLDGVWG